jgi:hypothetical protein
MSQTSTPELLRAIAARSVRVRSQCLRDCRKSCTVGCDECFKAQMQREPSLLANQELSELHPVPRSQSA